MFIVVRVETGIQNNGKIRSIILQIKEINYHPVPNPFRKALRLKVLIVTLEQGHFPRRVYLYPGVLSRLEISPPVMHRPQQPFTGGLAGLAGSAGGAGGGGDLQNNVKEIRMHRSGGRKGFLRRERGKRKG